MCILVEHIGKEWPSVHDPVLNGFTPKSHQLGRQIACGATVWPETNEKLAVKEKADDQSIFGTKW